MSEEASPSTPQSHSDIRILTNAPGHDRSETWRRCATRVNVNGNSTLGSLMTAWRMWRMRRDFDCIVLGSGRSDVFYSVLAALMPFGGPPVVRIDCLWYRPLNWLHGTLKRLLFRLERRSVNAYIVWARREVKDYSDEYGVPQDRLHFIPYHHTLDEGTRTREEGEYIFSGGNFARDYPTLLEAVRGLDYEVRIGCTRPELFEGLDLPENVVVRGYSHNDFMQAIADCAINVVVLEAGLLHSGGQQTFLNSMALGRPTVANDPEGARDYIQDRVNGWLVPPADPAALRRVLDEILSDREAARQVAAVGARVRETHSTERHFQQLIAFIRSNVLPDIQSPISRGG